MSMTTISIIAGGLAVSLAISVFVGFCIRVGMEDRK